MIRNWFKAEDKGPDEYDQQVEAFQQHLGRKWLITISILLIMGFTQLEPDLGPIISDIPTILSGQFSTIQGHLSTWSGNTVQSFLINGSMDDFFMILSKDYIPYRKGANYTVRYLPHSKYVIDILDETGKSLLKK